MKNKFHAKSIIIGRKKRDKTEKERDDDDRPCFIALFDENDPHTEGLAPREILDFIAHKVIIKNASELAYLLAGNDILINDLKEIHLEYVDHGHVIVDVIQNKK